jgi:di/tricarboxylate transporter
LAEVNLKRDYGFTVLGLSHHGHRVRGNRPAARLTFGDSLLLLGEADHLARLRRNPNLMLLVEESFPALGKRKALLTLLLLLTVIGLAVSNAVSPVITIPVAAFLAIVFGCIRIHDAYKTIDWPAVITVAGMIPFGVAMEKTETAADIAGFLVHTFAAAGPVAAMGAVFLLAIILTQLIENAAVAIILAPLAYGVAQGLQVNPKPFMVGLAICVSAGFCTPFAHESTILVMGPGHYRFKHYLQIGIVLTLLTWLVATFLTPLIWSLQPNPAP